MFVVKGSLPLPALSEGLRLCATSRVAVTQRELANFGVKLSAGWCPARQPSCLLNGPASRRHAGCSSRLGSTNVIRGSRRAASFLAREARRSLHQGR